MASTFRPFVRGSSTTRSGASFDERTINAVWNRATIVPGLNPNVQRKDACGAWIRRSDYGDTTQYGFGWEIDHVNPVSNGGTDDVWNLQPLQWQNNRQKGDRYPLTPSQYAAVIAKN